MIYDTETGQCRCLTTELLYSFSQKYPELKSQFGLVKIEMLSVYAFRDFAEALNTADEQEKLKAKQAEQQAAEAEAEAERAAADSVVQAAAASARSIRRAVPAKAEPVSPTETADSGEASQPAPAQVPATTDDPNKVQVKIPVQVPVQ